MRGKCFLFFYVCHVSSQKPVVLQTILPCLFLRAAEMQTFFGKGLFNVHAAVRQRPLAIEIVGMPLEKFQLLECIIH